MITGSTGYIGRNLVPKLLNTGHTILEVTIDPELSQVFYGNKTLKYVIDENQERLRNQIEKYDPEIVIHLASHLTSEDNYNSLLKLLNANVLFFCRILDALKNSNLQLFVNTVSFAEYGNGAGVFDPAYLYSSTKTASRSFLDYYSKVYNFKQVTIVPYTIYGGGYTQKKIIDILYDSIHSKIPLDLSPGEQILDFIYIEDVIDFYLKIVEKHPHLPDRINYQLGTGRGTNLRQLAMLIENETGYKTNINWGGKAYRKSDVMYAVAETSNIDFWKFKIDLEQGIALYLNSKTGHN